MDVTVTLSADPRRTVVIPIAVANQGTVTTDDYSGVPETVTFTSGDTSETITFQAKSDDVDDADGEAVKLGFGTMPETAVTAGRHRHHQRDHRHHHGHDDDNAGIVFMPTSLTVTEEDADGESYTVRRRLSLRPSPPPTSR